MTLKGLAALKMITGRKKKGARGRVSTKGSKSGVSSWFANFRDTVFGLDLYVSQSLTETRGPGCS